MINLGFLHPAKELASICREAFDVSTLSLSVDGVKREAALAGTRDTGHNDELVTWNANVDVLEVVLSCASD